MRKLIEAGAKVNAVFANGLTPLMVAARAGAHDAIEALLHHGADATATDIHGHTALLFLCNWGEINHYHYAQPHTRSARALLNAGADPYACDTAGDSAFWSSCRHGLTTVLALINARTPIPPRARHRNGDTPLLSACRSATFDNSRWSTSTIHYLIRLGCDIHATGADGKNAHQIIRAQLGEAGIRYLLPPYADTAYTEPLPLEAPPRHHRKPMPPISTHTPTEADAHGYTALHHAARRGEETMAKSLLAQGAVTDATANNGLTPLMLAARCGRWRVGLLLLAHGADRYRTDERGINAIDYARRAGNMKLYKAMQI